MIHSGFVEIDNLRIHFQMSQGDGPVLLLLHGNSCSSVTFKKQLSGSFGKKYKVFSIDLPGHGLSSHATDVSQYSLSGYANIIAKFIEVMGFEEVFLVGCSLGGHIALQAASLIPNTRGIAIYGAPPLNLPLQIEERFFPSKVVDFVFAEELSKEQVTLFVSLFFSPGRNLNTELFVDDMLRTAPEARPNLGKSIGEGYYMDETQIVTELTVPLAILHGENEQIVNGQYYHSLQISSLWRNSAQIVEDAGHMIHWEQPEVFNNLLESFISDTCDD